MDFTKIVLSQKENSERVDFPISEEELVRRYEDLFVSAVNDVLREDNLLYQALPHTIQPLDARNIDIKVCGFAFTIKGTPSLVFDVDEEMRNRAAMLEKIKQNDIAIWDTSHDELSAQWGGKMTKAVIKQGCRGAVIDGGARDTKEILETGFPVFCRYRTSNAMLSRFATTGYEEPIRIGEVTIYPGDVIFGDIDGVIVIPRKKAYDVLLRAEAIRDGEKKIDKMLESDMIPTEIVENGGYF